MCHSKGLLKKKKNYDFALKNYTNGDMEMVLGGIYDILMKQ